jgi:hypothetical protein
MIPLPTLDALDSVSIPVPCEVPWDDMHGDARTRHCDQCKQNVHDVSELSRAEALALIGEADTKPPCLRLYRRSDGRVMTADCATRRERAWKWLNGRAPRLARLFALVFFVSSTGCADQGKPCTFPTRQHETERTERAVTDTSAAIATGAADAAKP